MPVLSKIKISGTVYDLKDADSRTKLTTLIGSHAVEALGNAAWLGVDSTLTDGGTGVATSGTIKSYVDSLVETIPDFDVIVVQEGQDLPTASADTFHKIYLKSASSPVAPNLYVEYITLRSGTDPNYTYSWEKIGDTAMDLSAYVMKTRKVTDNLTLENDITTAQLQSALALDDFAYAAEGEATVASQTVTGLKAAGTLNPTLSGDLATTSTAATLTKADLTPAGTIAAKATDGSFAAVKTVEFVAANDGAIQVAGTNAASAVTFTGGTNATVLGAIDQAAVAPTFTEGAFTAATLTHAESAFATEGVVAAIDETDTEQLNITTASTANASLISAFTGGSKAADTFTPGSAATFTNATVVETIGTGEAAAQVFTGSKYNLNTTTDTALKEVEFTGTTITDALVTAVNYDKTTKGTLAIDAINASLDVDNVVVPQQTITVTPKSV